MNLPKIYLIFVHIISDVSTWVIGRSNAPSNLAVARPVYSGRPTACRQLRTLDLVRYRHGQATEGAGVARESPGRMRQVLRKRQQRRRYTSPQNLAGGQVCWRVSLDFPAGPFALMRVRAVSRFLSLLTSRCSFS